ncbi:DsbA family protein [Rhodospirillaceae bacterium]|nr:DsbA family protein [Rhodospirillaceae bacterium]
MQIKFLLILVAWFPIAINITLADTANVNVDVDTALSPRVEGSPDAKIKLVEYFSLTCPACAEFHTEVYPKIKKKYIDKGLVQMEYRDFPLDQWGLRAAALARCLEPKYYGAMVDVLLKQQSNWARSENVLESLLKIGQLAGLNEKNAQACMSNETLLDGIISGRMTGNKKHDVNTTPSFLINGEKIQAFEFSDFEALFNDILGQ